MASLIRPRCGAGQQSASRFGYAGVTPPRAAKREGPFTPLFNVELSSDSLFGVYRSGYGTQAISMEDVLEIKGGKDRRGGALYGLKIGALIGAGMGLLSSFTPEEACYVEPCPGTSGYLIQIAASGALSGVAIGAIRGNRIQFVITR